MHKSGNLLNFPPNCGVEFTATGYIVHYCVNVPAGLVRYLDKRNITKAEGPNRHYVYRVQKAMTGIITKPIYEEVLTYLKSNIARLRARAIFNYASAECIAAEQAESILHKQLQTNNDFAF